MNLDQLRVINDEIYDLRNEYLAKVSEISISKERLIDLRSQVIEKYDILENIRAQIRKQTLYWFESKKDQIDKNELHLTFSSNLVLTHLDSTKIENGECKVRFDMEPVLFRAALRNLHRAKQEIEKRKNKKVLQSLSMLEEIEASSLCIISSINCAEAYVNSAIQELQPALWYTLENMSLKGKWLVLANLLGSKDCFEIGKEEYNKFCLVNDWRNKIVHFKFGYENPAKIEDGRQASKVYSICNAKNAEQAVMATEAMIRKLCLKTGLPTPLWLDRKRAMAKGPIKYARKSSALLRSKPN